MALEAESPLAPPPDLKGFQRKFLRGMAHPLRPVVQVGEAGISDSLMAAIDAALSDHELVKVRLHQPEDKKAAARELADRSYSALCGLVGHTVILYRPNATDPRIEIPLRAGGA